MSSKDWFKDEFHNILCNHTSEIDYLKNFELYNRGIEDILGSLDIVDRRELAECYYNENYALKYFNVLLQSISELDDESFKKVTDKAHNLYENMESFNDKLEKYDCDDDCDYCFYDKHLYVEEESD